MTVRLDCFTNGECNQKYHAGSRLLRDSQDQLKGRTYRSYLRIKPCPFSKALLRH